MPIRATQREEDYKNGTMKHANNTLMELIAKASENGKIDSHLTPSFIHNW